jgi:peptide chain release factor 1
MELTLREVITLTVDDSLEGTDGVLQVNELTLDTSEDLGDGERLAQETLELTGTLDGELVSLRQFVHTQNGNDILEGLVLLEHLLDTGSGVVVLLADNTGVEHTGLGVERVDGRVDTQLGDTTGQHSGGVQVSEGGGGSRVSQIVSGHVDGLDGGNGTLGGGGNTLLHTTHVDGQGGLVTDGRGDTTQKGRHLRTGLGETEDVVNEEKHILTLLVTEVLGNGQTGQGDTGTGTRGLVHLTEDQRHLGFTIELNDTGLLHFVVQIVTLTGTLTDTTEDGVTTVSLGDVVLQLLDETFFFGTSEETYNQLLNEHGLTDTGTTEETNLTTTGVGGKEIDDLDTGNQNLGLGGLLSEGRSLSVDGEVGGGLDGAALVNGITSDVQDTAQSARADGDGDGSTGVAGGSTTGQTLGTYIGAVRYQKRPRKRKR